MAYQTPVTIADTLRQIETHEIVLPAIQREFVWRTDQIYNLFDSLMQGYPFGTFLYWKVKQEHNQRYQFYDFVLNYHERDRPHCPELWPKVGDGMIRRRRGFRFRRPGCRR